MATTLDVPVEAVEAEIRIYDVCVGREDLTFDALVDRDGDIRIEICENDFLRVAKERYGLVEATDE